MEIITRFPGAVPRVLPNGRTVFSHFWVKGELDAPKVSVELEIEVDALGQTKVVSETVKSLDGRNVDGELRRDIPDALLRQHAASVAASILCFEGSSDGEHRFAFLSSDAQAAAYRAAPRLKRRRGRRPPPNQVVDVIRYARAGGQTPANVIVDLWEVSLSTARRWIEEVQPLL